MEFLLDPEGEALDELVILGIVGGLDEVDHLSR
jgi:hypothetical protein